MHETNQLSRRQFIQQVAAGFAAWALPVDWRSKRRLSIYDTTQENEHTKLVNAFDMGYQLGNGEGDPSLLPVLGRCIREDSPIAYIERGHSQIELQSLMAGYFCSFWGIEDQELHQAAFDTATKADFLSFTDMQITCGTYAGACVVGEQVIFDRSGWIWAYWHELTHVIIEQNVENARRTDKTTEATLNPEGDVRFFSEGPPAFASLTSVREDQTPGVTVNLYKLNEYMAETVNTITKISLERYVPPGIENSPFPRPPHAVSYFGSSPLIESTNKVMQNMSFRGLETTRDLRKTTMRTYLHGDYMALAETIGKGLDGEPLIVPSNTWSVQTNPYAITLHLDLPEHITGVQKAGLTLLATNTAASVATVIAVNDNFIPYIPVTEALKTATPDDDMYSHIHVNIVQDIPQDQEKFFSLFDEAAEGRVSGDHAQILYEILRNNHTSMLRGHEREIMAILAGTLYRITRGSYAQEQFALLYKNNVMEHRFPTDFADASQSYYGIREDPRDLDLMIINNPNQWIPRFINTMIDRVYPYDAVPASPTVEYRNGPQGPVCGSVTPESPFISTFYMLTLTDEEKLAVTNININFTIPALRALIVDAVLRQFTRGKSLDARYKGLLNGVDIPFDITNPEKLAKFPDLMFFLLQYHTQSPTGMLLFDLGIFLNDNGIHYEQLQTEIRRFGFDAPFDTIHTIYECNEAYANGLLYLILLAQKVQHHERQSTTPNSSVALEQFASIYIPSVEFEQLIITAIEEDHIEKIPPNLYISYDPIE